jgi:hypothetical protein
MGALGVAVLVVALSALLSAELRAVYAGWLRALLRALSGAPDEEASRREAVAAAYARGGWGEQAGPPARGGGGREGARAPPSTPPGGASAPAAPAAPAGPVAAWAVADVAAWLRSLELSEHVSAFTKASVDGQLLLRLTADDLRGLGVASPLHAKKLRLRLLVATAAAQQVRRHAALRSAVATAFASLSRLTRNPRQAVLARSGDGSEPRRAHPPPLALSTPPAGAAGVPPRRTSPPLEPGGPTRRESLLSAAAAPEADDAPSSPRSGASQPSTSASASAVASCQAVLSGHAGWVTALAFMADGRLLSGSADATVRVWAPGLAGADDDPEHLLEGHAGAVRALAPMHARGCFASAGDDATVRVWSLAGADPCDEDDDGAAAAPASAHMGPPSPRCAAVLSGHGDAVYALAALPRGRLLSGSADRTLRLWAPVPAAAPGGVRALACTAVLEGHVDFVLALALLGAPPCAAVSASWDGTLRVWALPATGEPSCVHVLPGHEGPVRAVAALPCGHRCASGGADGAVRIWRPRDGECERIIPGAARAPAPPPPVLAIAALGRGCLAVALEDGHLRVWDTSAEPPAPGRAMRGHTKKVYALAAAPMREGDTALRLASGSRDRSVRVWALTS